MLVIAQAASKNEACFKSGQNRLKNNHLVTKDLNLWNSLYFKKIWFGVEYLGRKLELQSTKLFFFWTKDFVVCDEGLIRWRLEHFLKIT